MELVEPTTGIDKLIPQIHSTILSQGGDEACDAAEAVNADHTTSTVGQDPGHGTGEAILGTRHGVEGVVKGAGHDTAEGVHRCCGGGSEGDAGGCGKATSGTAGRAIKVALDADGTNRQGVSSNAP